MANNKKRVETIRQLFQRANSSSRIQWEYVNQKGFDFSNDNQLTESERSSLEEQGMPTFTINRILPVVEMLNFYATANQPRWQAIGADGSDVDVASLFADVADYIWYNSDGSTIMANTINDSVTKSLGYIQVDVDVDSDHGMGDVVIKQPEPFDIYVDPKARDILFRDASFILVRKVLPRGHLKTLFPAYVKKIDKASSDESTEYVYTEKSIDKTRKDFHYKDITESESVDPETGDNDQLIEFFELYEKVKVSYMNIFYRVPPDQETLQQISQQVEVRMKELEAEMKVKLLEQQQAMQQAVAEGTMLQERYDLEMGKAQKMMQDQLKGAEQEYVSQLQAEASKVENKVISEKEFKEMIEVPEFAEVLVDQVQFYESRIKHTKIIGDTLLSEQFLPETITHYPIIPFHFKWTGTPYPVSAVAPLIGKQREINKAHQIMVHNASLGSSLRWMHEEGSIDMDYWEKYSSSPGALLPIRPGANPPTPVQPMPLSNAFYQVVQEGKQDMEYLAGIYAGMQGDTGQQHDTFRGMLAMDEYGTRRIKGWLKHAIEPALRQLGTVIKEYSQSVYTAHKIIRIVQPNEVIGEKQVELNAPIYNDYGEIVGKFHDYAVAKFDVRIVAGSTLPVNRWAYLAELKELLKLGVVDDMAVLAETDVRNKERIAQRKSQLAQAMGQAQQLQEQLKDKEGTIETLERQLVQSGIKQKVMQGAMEVGRRKEESKTAVAKSENQTLSEQKFYRDSIRKEAELIGKDLGLEAKRIKNNLQTSNEKG